MSLPSPDALLYSLLFIAAVLIGAIVARPGLTKSKEGKIMAFLAFLVLPVLCAAWGGSQQIERSKQTAFCVSCHVM